MTLYTMDTKTFLSYTIPKTPEDRAFLELKKKIGGIVSKRRASLTLKEAHNFITLGQYSEESKPENHLVLDEIGYYLKIQQPKIQYIKIQQ